MRYGFWRGEPFEGCPRRGSQRDEPHGRQRGATNPQARRGASRRGGAKPRGRNTMSGPGNPDPKAAFRRSREWTRREARGGGATAGKATRGGTGRHRSARTHRRPRARFQRSRERSEDEAKVTGVDRPHFGASGPAARARREVHRPAPVAVCRDPAAAFAATPRRPRRPGQRHESRPGFRLRPVLGNRAPR
jgi:hypothetical protein